MFPGEPTDELTRRAQLRIGRMLREKWHLDVLLGVGGVASVYAATHRNGKRAALKILHNELAIDEEARGRFLREGYVANTVHHPGAVSVLDDDVTEDGSVFLVMELLEGETLDARAQRGGGSLVAAEVLWVADQVLDVLAAAHDQGILHRDLKPENLFVTREGEVKVLDFGIARMREYSTSGRSPTREGSAMGTPGFMAPEQARGRWELVDVRSDVWSVGATMFNLLAGRPVHQADTLNEELLAAMTQPAPLLGDLVRGLPFEVSALVDRALAFEREQRFPSARAMQAAVRQATASLSAAIDDLPPPQVLLAPPPDDGQDTLRTPSLSLGHVTPVVASAPRERRRFGPYLVGLAGATGVVALLTVVATSGHEPAPTPAAAASLSEPARAHAAARTLSRRPQPEPVGKPAGTAPPVVPATPMPTPVAAVPPDASPRVDLLEEPPLHPPERVVHVRRTAKRSLDRSGAAGGAPAIRSTPALPEAAPGASEPTRGAPQPAPSESELLDRRH
jgi:serine/threonine-protein kinase